MKNKPYLILAAAIVLSLCSGCNAQNNGVSEPAQNVQNEASNASGNRFANYDFDNVPETINLNEHPDISVKEEPPCYKFSQFDIPQQISDMVTADTKMVIGVPIKTSTYDFSPTGSDEGDRTFAEIANGNIFSNGFVTTVKVLYSPNDDFAVGDEVRIFTAGTGWGENLDRDKEYLLLFNEWEDVYKYSCGMDSIFEIASDFTVTSRSVWEATSQLDTLSLAEAVTVFDNTIKDKQALERYAQM